MQCPYDDQGGIGHSFLFQLLISTHHIFCASFVFMLNKLLSMSMSMQLALCNGVNALQMTSVNNQDNGHDTVVTRYITCTYNVVWLEAS